MCPASSQPIRAALPGRSCCHPSQILEGDPNMNRKALSILIDAYSNMRFQTKLRRGYNDRKNRLASG